jgi:hypothetical protein
MASPLTRAHATLAASLPEGTASGGRLLFGRLAAAAAPDLHSDAASDEDQQSASEEESGAADAAVGDRRTEREAWASSMTELQSSLARVRKSPFSGL